MIKTYKCIHCGEVVKEEIPPQIDILPICLKCWAKEGLI